MPSSPTQHLPVRMTLEADELVRLRRALEECRQERQAQLTVLQDPSSDDVDPAALAQTRSISDVLTAIDAALARMDTGAYGRCIHCARPIPLPRLELLPYTDGCVDCRRNRGSAG